MELLTRLRFDPDTHRHFIDGKAVPGMTQVMDDMGFTDATWFQQHHRDRGSAAHEICAEVAVLERPDSEFDWDGTCGCGAGAGCKHEIALPYAVSYQKWSRAVGFVLEPSMVEFQVASFALHCAGIVDQWGWVGGKRVLLDLKTGQPQAGAKIQLAGYRVMARESRGIETDLSYCLWLDKDGGFPKVVQPETPAQDERIFQSLMECWWWRKHHGLLPRNGRG